MLALCLRRKASIGEEQTRGAADVRGLLAAVPMFPYDNCKVLCTDQKCVRLTSHRPRQSWLKSFGEKLGSHPNALVQVSSAHSPCLCVVGVFARLGGQTLLGLVRPRRTDPCSGRPCGCPELLACPPSGGPALFPSSARWWIRGCATALPVGIAGEFTHTSSAWLLPGRVYFGPGAAWAGEPEPEPPACPAGVGIRPLDNLNTGYQPYPLPQ